MIRKYEIPRTITTDGRFCFPDCEGIWKDSHEEGMCLIFRTHVIADDVGKGLQDREKYLRCNRCLNYCIPEREILEPVLTNV